MRVSPFIRYDVTQRQRLDFDAHYLRADFEKQLENAQQDFSEEGVSAGWGYQFSERSSLTLRGVASRYETTFDTDAYGAYLQWDTNFTENSRVYVRAGAQQTEPENGESDTNAIAGIGGSWNSPRNTLFLDLTRTVEPISAGTVVERYQLRMQIRPRGVAARLTEARGARVARRGHRYRRHVPDAQVRGGRRRLRMARAAQLRGDRHLQLSVAGICG